MCFSTPSFADDIGKIGLRHLAPPPTNIPSQPSLPAHEERRKEDVSPTSLPTYSKLSLEESLIPEEELRSWNHLSEVVSAQSQQAANKIIYLIESERGAVPPQALFIASQSLYQAGDKEHAALYYLVGQLRLNFDKERWPAQENDDDKERIEREAKRTSDQALPNTISTPRIDNPHAGVIELGNAMGSPIQSWLIHHPEKFSALLILAKSWDESAPYLYQTGYAVNESAPFDQWKTILPRVRDDYFSHMEGWMKAINQIHY